MGKSILNLLRDSFGRLLHSPYVRLKQVAWQAFDFLRKQQQRREFSEVSSSKANMLLGQTGFQTCSFLLNTVQAQALLPQVLNSRRLFSASLA